jgi:hypothetical protein
MCRILFYNEFSRQPLGDEKRPLPLRIRPMVIACPNNFGGEHE